MPRLEVEPGEWDAFVDASDEAWLWHRHAMQDALATWPGKRDASFALRERRDGPLVAVMPLHSIEAPRLRRVRFMRFDSLGGPALADDIAERLRRRVAAGVLHQVMRLASEHRTTQVDVALSPLAPAFRGERCPRVNPLLELGMSNTLTQTWIVDLRTGDEALWNGMQGRARTAVRKAEKAGVTVRAADGPRDLEIYYRLHLTTCSRTGAVPLPIDYFRKIWEEFVPTGLARVHFAEHQRRVVAARSFAIHKAAAVCWTAASDEGGLASGANNLLQWDAMRRMARDGVEWSESGEAFPGIRHGKSHGLSQFKESFGGALYPIYRGRIEIDQPLARRLDGLRAVFARGHQTP